MALKIKDLDEPRRRALIPDVADVPPYSEWSNEELGELDIETALTIVERDLSGVSANTKERILARINDIRGYISRVNSK